MKTTEVKAYPRTEIGKRENKKLRKEDKVPGVIYDNSKAIHVYFDYKELRPTLYTADTYIVKLNLDGEEHNTIIREAQFHPVTEKILHIDLLKVNDEKAVTLTLPIEFTGVPTGVTEGGKLFVKLRKLTVEGIPSQLPASVAVDVSDLSLGQTIKVGEANIEGLEIVTPLTAALASVEIPRALRSAGLGEGEEGEELAEGEEAVEE